MTGYPLKMRLDRAHFLSGFPIANVVGMVYDEGGGG